jgi:acyl-CoA thioesterase FadM
MTAGINGLGGPTKSLAVRYRRPTPLHTPLRYVAHVHAVEERVVRVRGALVDADGTVYVEGEAEVARGARIGTERPV